jgi:hypothetical protein
MAGMRGMPRGYRIRWPPRCASLGESCATNERGCLDSVREDGLDRFFATSLPDRALPPAEFVELPAGHIEGVPDRHVSVLVRGIDFVVLAEGPVILPDGAAGGWLVVDDHVIPPQTYFQPDLVVVAVQMVPVGRADGGAAADEAGVMAGNFFELMLDPRGDARRGLHVAEKDVDGRAHGGQGFGGHGHTLPQGSVGSSAFLDQGGAPLGPRAPVRAAPALPKKCAVPAKVCGVAGRRCWHSGTMTMAAWQRLEPLLPAIKIKWALQVRDEPAHTPLGRPDTVTFLMDATLAQLAVGFTIPSVTSWLLACPPVIALVHGYCACGLGAVQKYFTTGEVALQLAAGSLSTAEIEEVLRRFRLLAQQEIAAVCQACPHRGIVGVCESAGKTCPG